MDWHVDLDRKEPLGNRVPSRFWQKNHRLLNWLYPADPEAGTGIGLQVGSGGGTPVGQVGRKMSVENSEGGILRPVSIIQPSGQQYMRADVQWAAPEFPVKQLFECDMLDVFRIFFARNRRNSFSSIPAERGVDLGLNPTLPAPNTTLAARFQCWPHRGPYRKFHRKPIPAMEGFIHMQQGPHIIFSGRKPGEARSTGITKCCCPDGTFGTGLPVIHIYAKHLLDCRGPLDIWKPGSDLLLSEISRNNRPFIARFVASESGSLTEKSGQ